GAADLVGPAFGAAGQVLPGVGAGDARRADGDAGVAGVAAGRARHPGRAGDAAAVAADHVGSAGGAVGEVTRLGADRHAGAARDGAGPAGFAADGAAGPGLTRDAASAAVADLVGAAVGASRHRRRLVIADRCPGRAGERPLVAGIGRHAGGALLAGGALPLQTDHPRPARAAVRLVGGFDADRRAGRARRGPRPAGFAGDRAGHAGGAGHAGAAAADHVLAADGAVGLGLLRVGAAGRAARAGDLALVAQVAGRTGDVRRAGGRVGA